MSCEPIPTQAAPALNQAHRLSSVGSTPPVGMILVHGIGPFTASTKPGPPTWLPGKTLTISAPSSSAREISETEPHPGDQRILRRLHILAMSSLRMGETIKLAPI